MGLVMYGKPSESLFEAQLKPQHTDLSSGLRTYQASPCYGTEYTLHLWYSHHKPHRRPIGGHHPLPTLERPHRRNRGRLIRVLLRTVAATNIFGWRLIVYQPRLLAFQRRASRFIFVLLLMPLTAISTENPYPISLPHIPRLQLHICSDFDPERYP
ncbi:hypothetical protein EJ06DRAFT_404715 [Trichodelitschia bisporula]|uniref:Uncharacterized protein n=1 Tax=Trichodelitschia bisporula TaxID=703511 RepID=A0A6G1HXH7_9PEZI|nr:hypothetical protein EJ06DRAFT_404715 [Trichodelitschia bisporula]